jgi:preprotein translocase subunit YajC
MLNLSLILTSVSGGGAEGDSMMQFLPIIAVIVVFWLFFIRPQTKKAKDERKFREELKKGDKIVTIGGIHGKITEVAEKTVTIELLDKTKMMVEKNAVSMAGADEQQVAQK